LHQELIMPHDAPKPAAFEPAWLQRSLDRHYAWGLVFMAVLILGFVIYGIQEPTLRARAAQQQQATYAHLGAGLFANNCASCHGRAATGGSAPTLNSKQFLTTTSDEQARLLIAGGVSGTSMPAWSLDFGGPLTDEQIRQLVAYLRSLQPNAPDVPNWRQGKP
jgi:mono/diheme cytochrome c family protein